MTPFLGIYREPEYSPGQHTSNDVVILRLVGQALERAGVEVEFVTLAGARTRWADAPLVFSMCQGPEALAELAQWKAHGALIVNDPTASRQTYRDRLCPLLGRDGVPFPRSLLVPTVGPIDRTRCEPLFRHGAVWAKRHDVHATCADDVVRLDEWAHVEDTLADFRGRGLHEIVLQEHRPGDEVKFYGVLGGHFFWHFYPGTHAGYPFDGRALRRFAELAAGVVGVGIYGGDAIIAPDGRITLIDLNDWPSFAPCRGAAAEAIARHLLEQARQEHTVQRRDLSHSS